MLTSYKEAGAVCGLSLSTIGPLPDDRQEDIRLDVWQGAVSLDEDVRERVGLRWPGFVFYGWK